MIEAGIFDGDYVVVRQQPDADNGDIVVAGIPDDEAHRQDLLPARGQGGAHPGQSGVLPHGVRPRRR